MLQLNIDLHSVFKKQPLSSLREWLRIKNQVVSKWTITAPKTAQTWLFVYILRVFRAARPCGKPTLSLTRQHSYCLPSVSINPQTQPQAAQWVISCAQKKAPNQSVINSLYGARWQDEWKYSGIRGSFGHKQEKKRNSSSLWKLDWGSALD